MSGVPSMPRHPRRLEHAERGLRRGQVEDVLAGPQRRAAAPEHDDGGRAVGVGRFNQRRKSPPSA